MADTAASKEMIQSFYGHLKEGNPPAAFAMLADDVVWMEAEGNPLAATNPHIGVEAIVAGVFEPLSAIFEDFAAVPEEFVAEGARVVTFGRYLGRHKESGEALSCQFVHSWTLADGKIVRFQQYADTEQLTRLS